MIFKKLKEKIRDIKISRKEKQIKQKTEKYENRSEFERTSHRKSTYSKILAREILITETFINRISRETKRPVIVIGNGGTGKPYTWSIKNDPKRNIFIENFNFPSSGYKKERIEDTQNKLTKLIENTTKKIFIRTKQKPIFVFVDASRQNRMPASFTGIDNPNGFVKVKDAIHNLFENKKTTLIGYDWSMHDNTKYLPKNKEISTSDIILFNPVREREQTIRYSAYHDNRGEYQSRPYKNYVLKRVDILKHNLFKDKKKPKSEKI